MINKEFRTILPVKPEKSKIDYNSRFFSIGSCFSVHMAEKLRYYGFHSIVNPFGILFHPLAIEDVFKHLSTKIDLHVFKNNHRWNSFLAHSDLSGATEEELYNNLKIAIACVNAEVPKTSHFLITLGSAWVYRHVKSQKIVANCHKIAQQEFCKELLTVESISASISSMIQMIRGASPNAMIIFAVSPIRHLKDGFVENQRSKANLITALHDVIDKEDKIFYFPSYEILMDDLRDYRFYASDMVHPSAVAIEYVWQKFVDVFIENPTQNIMAEVAAVRKAHAHRPFDENAPAYLNFIQDINSKKRKLEQMGVFLSL